MANMTSREQMMLELVNRARMDPAGEAKRFGIDLNEGLSSGTLSSLPKQVLAGSDTLAKSADNHSNWMIKNDIFSHGETKGMSGFTGASPQDRMTAAGYAFTGNWTNGENIAFRGTTQTISSAMQTQFIIQQHADLFIDEGIVGRGHRLGILKADFEEVGIGQQMGVFTSDGKDFNVSMVTQNFAASGNKIFVTGVIYDDDVITDNFYSVGEQVANVSVTSSGAISDKTGTGGGYELLYTASGDKTVKFALSSGTISVGLTLGSTNVKVDIVNGKEVWTNTFLTSVSSNVTELHVLGIAKTDLNGANSSQTMYGNRAVNVLKGNDGNDTLIGRGGADRLDGGAGTDTASYAGASKGVIANLSKAGDNTNDAKGDIYVSVENLTGSSHADTLSGNASRNSLSGGSGNDVLTGVGGNDTLYGGAGADDLYGGAGDDVFIYKAVSESTLSASGRDTIFDFTREDTIDFSTIDANSETAKNDAFSFIGTKAFSGKAGELRFDKKASDTYIYGDINGDRKIDFAVHLGDAVTIEKGFFIL